GIQGTIESFTIEASIAKVFSSEVSGGVIDEALQLFGGSGYVQGHPIERLYRDLRIARIYEGTNEINRLLIAGTLLRRILSLPGTMNRQLLSHLHHLPSYVEMYTSNAYRAPSAPPDLVEAIDIHERAKLATIYVLMEFAHKFATTIESEHEFFGYIADALINIYAIDSSLARALFAIRASSPDTHLHILTATLVTMRYMSRLQDKLVTMFHVIYDGPALIAELQKFHDFLGVYRIDVIRTQRELATLLIERGGYPFLDISSEM
ncbi:MAG TPA: acyl-CoA dehydrogenase family protein, partial [Ktedonobacteraceae bacterium]|nr:acyl-CoA dehydrogenase family protein [Ktedonobacteraceae bacterium]